MSRRVTININGKLAEVSDVSKIPLILKKRLDKWESFVGTDGTRADNISRSLAIPYSKNNADIAGYSALANYDNESERLPQPTQIYVDSLPIFSGTSILKQTIGGSQSESLQYDLLGDNLDIFTFLEGISLRDLDLGDAPSGEADIIASWTALGVTSNPLVWCPVVYGGLTIEDGSTNISTSLYKYSNGLRPSVRIWEILYAIFTKLVPLNYVIISNLYETEQFRNLLYPFGVGDDWARNDSWQLYTCFIGKISQQIVITGTFIDFDNEGLPFSDSQNLNDSSTLGSTFFDSANGLGDAWYQFEFFIAGSDIDSVELVGVSFNPAGTSVIASFPANQRNTTDPILFTPNRGLTRLFFRVVCTTPTCTIEIDNTYYFARMTNRFAYGAPLVISSCLHDLPVKDFLRGLQHLYGLVFNTDPITKTIEFDPRFINPTTQNDLAPTWLNDVSKSYYNQVDTPKELVINNDYSIANRKVFNDWLVLGYAADSSDALLTYYNKEVKTAGQQDIWGLKNRFIQKGLTGTTNKNPFFTPLLNLQISNYTLNSSGLYYYAIYPCICDDFQQLVNDFESVPSYKSSPKIAQYYGVLDFSAYVSGIGAFEYPFVYTDSTGAVTVTPLIPTMFQVFPDWKEYWDVLGKAPFNLSYSDINYTNLSVLNTLGKVFGLVTRFHWRYLRCIKSDKWLTCIAIERFEEFYTESFKDSVFINFGGEITKWWVVEISAFQPLQKDLAQFLLILDDTPETGDYVTDFVANNDNFLYVLDQRIF
jgi:hypothetical protein